MTAASSNAPQRAYWLKKLHEWHWISSAICLIGMLLFAVTGFTLNHAGQIEAKPKVETREAQLPADFLEKLQQAQKQSAQAASKDVVTLPTDIEGWLAQQIKVSAKGFAVEWSEEEAYVPLPRPGGDAWLRVDMKDGAVEYETTDRGWISYLNDLHKGRHAGAAWSLFIDLFAIGCLVFCITGLLILKMHAQRRPMTWPMVGLGFVLPVLLVLLLVH